MKVKTTITLLFIGIVIFSYVFAKESIEPQQEMSDFSLSGYDSNRQSNWKIQGKSAQILNEGVLLNDVLGSYYGKTENVTISANRGKFDREKGFLHLEDNVVINTSSGARLITNSLDWDRQKELIIGKDPVKIIRPSWLVEAKGIEAQPNLKKISLNKEVKVDLDYLPKKEKDLTDSHQKNKIIITCDGPLEIDYENNIAIFKNNVKVNTQDNVIYSETLEVYFGNEKTSKPNENSLGFEKSRINKIVARGNVKIVRGENISYSQEAIYDTNERKIILKGYPQLIISPEQEKDASS